MTFSETPGTTDASQTHNAPQTRRSLRAAAQRDAVPAVPRADDLKRPSRARRERLGTDVAAVAARTAPSPRKTIRQQLSAGGTLVIVGGLVASLALPAYASAGEGPSAPTQNTAATTSQSLEVGEAVAANAVARDAYGATSAADIRAAYRQTEIATAQKTYVASEARSLGDDYPWYDQLTVAQGGGLSPLRYYYRECVDFVAWRLNRDAGTTSAPFRWDWSTLTPGGGNASAWAGAWQAKGWPTGNVPEVGAVAWFNYNHVAYVSAVNADGTVLLEEYNWNSDRRYHQRVVGAGEVPLYLYAPPR